MPRPPRVKGQPKAKYHTYSDEWALGLLVEVGQGKTVLSICKRSDQPSFHSVMGWLNEKPEFAEAYARAKGCAMDAMAEELLQLADSATKADWQCKRLQVETRKWIMGKLNPKKYGDKYIHEPSGTWNVNWTKAEDKV